MGFFSKNTSDVDAIHKQVKKEGKKSGKKLTRAQREKLAAKKITERW